MRAPAFCTLTGADDTIELGDLFRLSSEFPFVEWSILFHAAHHGVGRFPSLKWIEDLCGQMCCFPSAHFALHICGQEAIGDFLRVDGSVSCMATAFRRVQLNLVAKNVDPALLIGVIQRYPDSSKHKRQSAPYLIFAKVLSMAPCARSTNDFTIRWK